MPEIHLFLAIDAFRMIDRHSFHNRSAFYTMVAEENSLATIVGTKTSGRLLVQALVNRDLRTFARFISFQQKRGDKHNRRAHCQQPVHIDVRENCSLGLNQSIQTAQGLLLSCVPV